MMARDSDVSFSNRPSRSSTFRLTATAMSTSLTGSCFSSESAQGPLHGVFFVKEFARAANLSFVGCLFRSQGPFLRPDLRIADLDARREGPPNRADPDRNTAISKTLPDFVQGQVRLSRHQFYRSR